MRSSSNLRWAHLSCSDGGEFARQWETAILWDSQYCCTHSLAEGRNAMCNGHWFTMRGRTTLWQDLILVLPWWFISLWVWRRTEVRRFTSSEILHRMTFHFMSSSFSPWDNFHCATVNEGICNTILVWRSPSFPTLSLATESIHQWGDIVSSQPPWRGSYLRWGVHRLRTGARRKIGTGFALSKQSLFLFSLFLHAFWMVLHCARLLKS